MSRRRIHDSYYRSLVARTADPEFPPYRYTHGDIPTFYLRSIKDELHRKLRREDKERCQEE